MLNHDWYHLESVIDLQTKKIVGYFFGRSITKELIMALEHACLTQEPGGNLIFHSNLDTQYKSDVFKDLIDKYQMKNSFSHKGSPYDKTCTKSFHAVLKKKVSHIQYTSYKFALFQYIEG